MKEAHAKMKKLSLCIQKLKEALLKVLMFTDDIVFQANTEVIAGQPECFRG